MRISGLRLSSAASSTNFCVSLPSGTPVFLLLSRFSQPHISFCEVRIPPGRLPKPLLRGPVLPFVEIEIADLHFVFGLQRIERVLFGLLGFVLFRRHLLLRGGFLLFGGFCCAPEMRQTKASPSQRDIIKLYCPQQNSEKKPPNCPWRPACICTKTPPGASSTSARPRTCGCACAATSPTTAGRRQDRHADLRSRGHRLHPGRQRQRSAGAREQPHQAVEAALQHPAARRQDLSVHQADQREISARVRDAPLAQGRLHLLRPVLSRRTWRTGWCTSFIATFMVPSCKVDLTRNHPKPCLQYHIHRCLGPCVEGLTTDDAYARRGARRAAVSGRPARGPGGGAARAHGSTRRRRRASKRPASLRDLLSTVEEMDEQQKMAAAKGDDIDIFAVLRRAAAGGGEPVPPAQRPDRGPARVLLGGPARVRPAAVLLLAAEADLSRPAVHPGRSFTCRWISRIARRWRNCSREKRGRKVEIHTPQRGQKKAMLDLVETNAKHSFEQRFRVLKPSSQRHSGSAAGRAGPARTRPSASSASTSRTSRAPTKWPAWWCGKTGG